ncbi:unnamed protein product [Moneuplotes crassus]|uniref:Uncharacterized protein n=1 Tax=Euplotes crassus TaxID=5936 RepID=A0AAD1XJU1_EUPCR|nr:unnamed protein product [Moneuplotes crassus]
MLIPEVPDFSNSLRGTKLEEIHLTECELICRSNCKKNNHEFDNLVRGLATSRDVKKSLKLCITKGRKIDGEYTKKVLKDNRFSHIKLET